MNDDELSKQTHHGPESSSPDQTGIDSGDNLEVSGEKSFDSLAANDPTTQAKALRRNDSPTPASDDRDVIAETAELPDRSAAESAKSRQIGNYRLLQRLGSGGLGEVGR
ncbi:MAG: hypothetical protein Q8M16_16510 [Pirellulaceae bacterium]|nr:hypothetical protein [Pirellulaceae bacterium]